MPPQYLTSGHRDIDGLGGNVRQKSPDPIYRLASGGRHLRCSIDRRQIVRRLRRRHFFEPEEIQRLEALSQFQTTRKVEMTVHVNQQVAFGSNGRPDGRSAVNAEPGKLFNPRRVG
jgi:hypothetical protein